MATVDVGGPFKIETKPYNIAAKVVLAADEKPKPPAPTEKPSPSAPAPTLSVTKAAPETPKAEMKKPKAEPEKPEPVTAKADKVPATDRKSGSWIILSGIIGLGVVAAGLAIYKNRMV